jgi:hypothetical protein
MASFVATTITHYCYQGSGEVRSGIESNPNRIDDQGHIAHLIGQVITVSIETVKLVNELAQAVRCEDWLGETMGWRGGNVTESYMDSRPMPSLLAVAGRTDSHRDDWQ